MTQESQSPYLFGHSQSELNRLASSSYMKGRDRYGSEAFATYRRAGLPDPKMFGAMPILSNVDPQGALSNPCSSALGL